MAEPDYSKLSNEELLALKAKRDAAPTLDYSKMSDQELLDLKAGKKLLEHPDAPTIASLPLPGARGSGWITGKPTMGWGDKAAALFGPLLTDNPKARQEILEKHLPGAKAVSDKFGNPMIEYEGKRYYASRPGEIDAMDVGRGVVGAAVAAPAAALAPVSVPLAAATFGTLGVAQSLGEDWGTRALGGKSQEIDPLKAAISGAVGAVAPPAAKVIGTLSSKIAPLVYRLFGPEFTDAAGQLTPRGARFFQEAGIDATHLEPQQVVQLAQVAKRNMGNPDVGQPALRQMLGEEFNVPQTRAMITGDPAQIALEDRLRRSKGPAAERIMGNFATEQQGALSEAQQALRGGTPLQPPLNADEAGGVLQRGFNARNTAARGDVSQAYTDAFDPALLAQHGVPPVVPLPYVRQMGAGVRADLQAPGPGRLIVNDDFPDLAPRAAKMLDKINGWSQRMGPRGAITIDWEGVDAMRRELNQLRPAFNPMGDNTDFNAANRIMRSFDRQLGQINPLLNDARNLHAARKNLFEPGSTAADSNTRSITKVLGALDNNGLPLNSGTKVANNIFDASLKRGEALPAIEHLERIYGANSAEMEALKNEALRRVMTDAQSGAPLSPQRAATAIGRALDGPQRDVYERLLGPDGVRELRRFHMLNNNIAQVAANRNPSGSGHMIAGLLNKWGPVAVGEQIGQHVGHAVGGTPGALIGAAVGGTGGGLVERLLARRAALGATAGGNMIPSATAPFANLMTRTGVLGAGSARGLLDEEELRP